MVPYLPDNRRVGLFRCRLSIAFEHFAAQEFQFLSERYETMHLFVTASPQGGLHQQTETS